MDSETPSAAANYSWWAIRVENAADFPQLFRRGEKKVKQKKHDWFLVGVMAGSTGNLID